MGENVMRTFAGSMLAIAEGISHEEEEAQFATAIVKWGEGGDLLLQVGRAGATLDTTT
jgi:hypothetical protein